MDRDLTARRTLALVGVGLMVVVCLAGCYRKVVGARGFGADGVAIERGNVPSERPPGSLGYKTLEHRPIPAKSN